MKGMDFFRKTQELLTNRNSVMEVVAVQHHMNGTTFVVTDVRRDQRGLIIVLGERLN